MQVDLDLYGYRFNWALTIFYIPYLLYAFPLIGIPGPHSSIHRVEIPSNIILKKVGAKIYCKPFSSPIVAPADHPKCPLS